MTQYRDKSGNEVEVHSAVFIGPSSEHGKLTVEQGWKTVRGKDGVGVVCNPETFAALYEVTDENGNVVRMGARG